MAARHERRLPVCPGLAALPLVLGCAQVIEMPDRVLGAHWSCGNGVCQCDPSFGDCDGNPENGCESDLTLDARHCGACESACAPGSECVQAACQCAPPSVACTPGGPCVDVQNDGENCGVCGHDCLGGACLGGTCQPVALTEGAFNAEGSLTLAQGVLYFSDYEGVLSVPTSGGVPTRLVVAGNSPTGDFVLRNGLAYWTQWVDEPGLFSQPLDGGAVVSYSTTLVWPNDLVITGDVAYTADFELKQLMRVSLTQDLATSLAPVVDPRPGMVLDGTLLYFADGPEIRRLDVSDDTVALVAQVDALAFTGFVLSGGDIYATTNAPGAVLRIAPDGTPTTLAEPDSPIHLLVDQEFVYLSTWIPATVARVPKAGGPLEILAQGLDGPGTLAADETCLYWVGASAIMRLRKP